MSHYRFKVAPRRSAQSPQFGRFDNCSSLTRIEETSYESTSEAWCYRLVYVWNYVKIPVPVEHQHNPLIDSPEPA